MNIQHKSIYLKRPTLEELRFTEALLADEATMSFNQAWGGTVAFPKEQWPSFYQRYLTGDPHYIYFHIYNLDHVMVGEVSARYQASNDAYMLNIKVIHKYRGNHHAYDALECFLAILFEDYNIDTLIDDVAIGNDGGYALMKRVGFQEVGQTEETIILQLTKAEYFNNKTE